MASTHFVDNDISTANRIVAAWLNDVNDLTYGGTTAKGAALLKFLSTKAGAAEVSVGTLLDEIPSLSDFGVKYDGTDETAKVQAAVTACRSLLIPPGKTVKLTSYVQIPSNTTLHILGTVQVVGRAAGFYSDTAENIGIYGHKIGTFTDPSVVSAYGWNNGIIAPCIHLRFSNNCVVDGLNFYYVSQGTFYSNMTTNTYGSGWTPNYDLTKRPNNALISNNHYDFCEMSACAGFWTINTIFLNNYVKRAGDGGMWLMGSESSVVMFNTLQSTATVAQDCLTYGGHNLLAYPTTWNNIQGIEFENCQLLLIHGNRIYNYAHISIDVKNNCEDVDVTNNLIWNGQSCGIAARGGETNNPVIRVGIKNNQIFNQGTLLFPDLYALHSVAGAICCQATFMCDVSDNEIESYQHISYQAITISVATPAVCTSTVNDTDWADGEIIVLVPGTSVPTGLLAYQQYFLVNTSIVAGVATFNLALYPGGPAIATSGAGVGTQNAYRLCPGIHLEGPGGFYTSPSAGSPFQSVISATNNKIWFKNHTNETVQAFDSSRTTASAIVATGLVDSITLNGNIIKADRFLAVDTKINTIPAIYVSYQTATLGGSPVYYPQTTNLTGNTVNNWMGPGIECYGQPAQLASGFSMTGNCISGVGAMGVHLVNVSGFSIVGGNISNIGPTNVGISLEGTSANHMVAGSITGVNIYGREVGGTNGMTYGISASYVDNLALINNNIQAYATNPLSLSNCTDVRGGTVPALVIAALSAGFDDQTGDGTVANLTSTTWTVITDATSSFTASGGGPPAGGTFTAPKTAKYTFYARLALSGLLVGHTEAELYVTINSVKHLIAMLNPYAVSVGGVYQISGQVTASMTLAQTAFLTLAVTGSTKTVDVLATDASTFWRSRLEIVEVSSVY